MPLGRCCKDAWPKSRSICIEARSIFGMFRFAQHDNLLRVWSQSSLVRMSPLCFFQQPFCFLCLLLRVPRIQLDHIISILGIVAGTVRAVLDPIVTWAYPEVLAGSGVVVILLVEPAVVERITFAAILIAVAAFVLMFASSAVE